MIGAVAIGEKTTDGETIKNQMLLRRFEDLYDQVITIDTIRWRKHPLVLLQLLWKLLCNRTTPVVISASISSRWLLDFLYYVPLNKNINYWVIGGALPQRIKAGIFKLRSLAKLNSVIVEGKKMAIELQEMGLNNVVHVPNFKPIEYTPTLKQRALDRIHFVFMSRIHPKKGIYEIVEACKELNLEGYEQRFDIDFYGAIESGFETEFRQLISACHNTQYKGFLNLTNNDGYETLAKYDTMLFPTYWDNEGFPGIVIDAYIAGLPIIASDWNLNAELIIENQTGFIIPPNDSRALAQKMKEMIDGNIDLYTMRCLCAENARHYDYRNVVTTELLQKLHIKQ